MVFTQKFSSGDYLFVYDCDDNNVVVLIYTPPWSADTTEAEIPDEEVVDNMLDDVLEEMEWKHFNICDNSDSSCGGGELNEWWNLISLWFHWRKY